MKFCMNCGAQLPDEARFCVACGKPVDGAPASASPASSGSSLNEEEKSLVKTALDAVKQLEGSINAYQKEASSKENREKFYQDYKVACTAIDALPEDVKGEVSEPWGMVGVVMSGLRTSTNKMMKITSFGMSAGSADAQMQHLKGSLAKVIKGLKSALEGGTSSGAQAMQQQSGLSEEERILAGKALYYVKQLEHSIDAYQKEASSKENREKFYQDYKVACTAVDELPEDVKGEVSEAWGMVGMDMSGLRTSTNKMMKISSFGMSAGSADAQMQHLKGQLAKVIKGIKSFNPIEFVPQAEEKQPEPAKEEPKPEPVREPEAIVEPEPEPEPAVMLEPEEEKVEPVIEEPKKAVEEVRPAASPIRASTPDDRIRKPFFIFGAVGFAIALTALTMFLFPLTLVTVIICLLLGTISLAFGIVSLATLRNRLIGAFKALGIVFGILSILFGFVDIILYIVVLL